MLQEHHKITQENIERIRLVQQSLQSVLTTGFEKLTKKFSGTLEYILPAYARDMTCEAYAGSRLERTK